MKTCRKLLLVIVTLTLCVGCDENFLETAPKDSIAGNEFWKTVEHAELGVTAIYNVLREQAYINELGMDDAMTPIAYRYGGNRNWDTMQLYAIVSGNATTRTRMYNQRWTALYLGIYRANEAIANIPNMETNLGAQKDQFLGEALFLRGLFYFDLLNYYGGQDDARHDGVPLYTEPTSFTQTYKPRSKPSEVRALIIDDLAQAIDFLPSTGGSVSDGRASKGAAMALLGKVYLYNKQYTEAANMFKQVIDLGDYQLGNDYGALFSLAGEKNTEVIFALQNEGIQDFGGWRDLRYGPASSQASAKNSSIPTNYFVDSYRKIDGSKFDRAQFLADFETNNGRAFDWENRDDVNQYFADRDPRLEASIIRPFSLFVGRNNTTYEFRYPRDTGNDPYPCMRTVNNTNNHYGWRKFVNVGDESAVRRHSGIDYPVIRYADVLLMYAEARNEASAANAGNASDDLYWAVNQVRDRVDMPDIPVGTQAEVRDLIREERMIELAAEGMFYSDFRRWYENDPSFNLSSLDEDIFDFTGTVKLDTRRSFPGYFLYPIPEAERDLNPDLTQNPGW
ncbi:RagB/SusD family nutrient uptake outer membrane protein [Flavivirga sp. 57AJ16]|uniref:RagB/SusD family nutrient uptake outer membrane protein n=1 Tax=Flavivirga sp. 57AJ16 TaxID=3025307 RepID=UPI00236522AE|nr:RagB/SusD family nutrient uptake outer membrane protein [Flavivirga sp. 57AJ16]MDD7885450.1 RagB/SusD family nutrient uptake outer membrane protein [Flavivirga sp. 57AJ16]